MMARQSVGRSPNPVVPPMQRGHSAKQHRMTLARLRENFAADRPTTKATSYCRRSIRTGSSQLQEPHPSESAGRACHATLVQFPKSRRWQPVSALRDSVWKFPWNQSGVVVPQTTDLIRSRPATECRPEFDKAPAKSDPLRNSSRHFPVTRFDRQQSGTPRQSRRIPAGRPTHRQAHLADRCPTEGLGPASGKHESAVAAPLMCRKQIRFPTPGCVIRSCRVTSENAEPSNAESSNESPNSV